MSGRTMFEKVWDDHVVVAGDQSDTLLYVDLHLVHEVTSPQAFEGLRLAGRSVRRPELTIATVDHNIPTTDRSLPIVDEMSRLQVKALRDNAREFGVRLFDVGSREQGIVHVLGPEQGFTLPGMTIVCGDSHTSTHGAFGALAYGIGTSEVEHVLATQCLRASRPKTMLIQVKGTLAPGVTAKDLILHVISVIGVGGAAGFVIEYAGSAIRSLSMEGRMTVCNMSIEAGARAGMIAPDETTYAYLRGRPHAPEGERLEEAVRQWRSLPSDGDAVFDSVEAFDAADIVPMVTWGTNPAMAVPITGLVPDPKTFANAGHAEAGARAVAYMGLKAGTPIESIAVDRVFIGSCTNARLEDLRSAASIVRGQRVASTVQAMVVPGSTQVKLEAEAEGLADTFRESGFEWREAGCSMCLGMNPDKLSPFERCASTSNRNFEGRQGTSGRTHLVSPAMAAAAAIAGHFVDVREWMEPAHATV